MSIVALKIPEHVIDKLSSVKVPGKRVHPDEMHVTILHLGKNLPIGEVLKVTMASYLVSSKQTRFPVMTRLVTSFPGGGQVPVIARLESPGLHKLRDNLTRVSDALGVEYSTKFPEFKPHITLAYSKDEPGDVRIMPIGWMVDEIVIWGGNQGQEKITVQLPFGS